MAQKKITSEQVGKVLGTGYFESNRKVESMDPIEPTPMRLRIDQIDPFDRNPRRSKNPEYDSILESLRAGGQEEALTITRRPGSTNFMIKRGGNTRLEIMNLLFHEANDIRFEWIDCLFMPWTSESDCIVGHLNENTTQGRMTLIDKARGYRDFKIEYEKEHNLELGQRKLAELLKRKGASVNHKLLGVMFYALDILEPAIPDTLAGGLGKPQVEKLKRLDQTFQRLADAHNLFEPINREAQIRAEFINLLSQFDGDDWDMDLIIHEFTQLIGKLLEQISFDRLKYDIGLCLKSDPWKVELISIVPEEEDFADQEIPIPEEKTTTSLTHREPQKDKNNTDLSEQSENKAPVKTPHKKQEISSSSDDNKHQPSDDVSLETDDFTEDLKLPDEMFTAGSPDLKSIRSRIYTLALKFAQATGVHSSVVPWKYGYGYFMDLPKSKLNECMSQDQLSLDTEYQQVANRFIKDRDEAQRSFAWWLLWQCQGLLDFRQPQPLPGYHKLPECMMKKLLNQMYNPEDTNIYKLAFSAMGHIWLQAGGPRQVIDMSMAYSYIKPQNMRMYIALLEARTQLMQYVEEQSINLWEDRS